MEITVPPSHTPSHIYTHLLAFTEEESTDYGGRAQPQRQMQARVGMSELDQREREAQELHELERFVKREGGEGGRRGKRVPVLLYTMVDLPLVSSPPTHRDIVDLREIQHDIAVMVEEQGEGVDRIGREGGEECVVREDVILQDGLILLSLLLRQECYCCSSQGGAWN